MHKNGEEHYEKIIKILSNADKGSKSSKIDKDLLR